MSIFKRIHLPALGGLLSSVVGLIGLANRPDVAPVLHDIAPSVLTPEWSAALTAVGVAVLTVSKAIHRGDETH